MNPNSHILKQSCSYNFVIHKKLETLGEGQVLYILIGPGDKKYLLSGEYYTHYDLKIGQDLKCRVDKINCSGQVFLEPKHPHYQVGESYDFLVKEIVKSQDHWGNTMHSALVEDVFKKTWACMLNKPDNIEPGKSKIRCIVNKIKKGELFLILKDYNHELSKLEVGEFYKFKIVDERVIEDKEYLILLDPFGSKHLLLKEYYTHFNYRLGQVISVRIIDMWPDMSYKLEPNNPGYLIGGIYNFKILRLDLLFNALGEVNGVYQLEDSFGIETPVAAQAWQINNPQYNPIEIRCRVVNYKKGKLVLENIEEQEL